MTAFYSKQEWNSVAPAWQKWWKTIEKGTEGVSRRLVELAEIKPGSRVLDIATGKTKSYFFRSTRCDLI